MHRLTFPSTVDASWSLPTGERLHKAGNHRVRAMLASLRCHRRRAQCPARSAIAASSPPLLGSISMGLFGIIGTIIVGFIVGLIARAIMPGVDSLGFWLTTALGIGGSGR